MLINFICALQPCFESISGQLQHAILADCNAVVNNQDAYDGLLNNLALICASKGSDPLVAVACGKYNIHVLEKVHTTEVKLRYTEQSFRYIQQIS